MEIHNDPINFSDLEHISMATDAMKVSLAREKY